MENSAGQLKCTASNDPLAAQTAHQGRVRIQHSGNTRERITVSLTASSQEEDYRSGNDRTEQTLIFSASPDMDLSFGAPSAGAEAASVPLTVSNKATHESASNISFTLNLPSGITLENPGELNCNSNPWVCQPGHDLTVPRKIPSSIDYSLKLSADAQGSYDISAAAGSDSGDFPDAARDDSVSILFFG